jgi:hypothetical protein
MKKIIVTTTISPPTEASWEYSHMEGWEYIVVADKKTPIDFYSMLNCNIFTCEAQESKYRKLSDLIGWNCVERKNLGILLALESGADIIAIVDDDNIPMDNWGKNIVVGREIEVNYFETDNICFDPIYHTNYPHLWHRGFPLELLQSRVNYKPSVTKIIPDVQAGFWNGDPDIDAICRMEHAPYCEWEAGLFPIASNTFSPFNSQNTILSRAAAKEYSMLCETGRMTDIWASYYLQARGFKVVYTEADVFHQRHKHNLMVDYLEEIQGNIDNFNLLEDLKKSSKSINIRISPRSVEALQEYERLTKQLL